MNYQADNKGFYGKFGGAYIPELLRRNIDELENAYIDILESEGEIASILAHELTFSAFQERIDQDSGTGEWLIFSKHKGRNYYLSIASHSKTHEGDKKLYEFIKNYCYSEFPFLFEKTS